MIGYQAPKSHINPFYFDNLPYGKPYEKPKIVKVTKMNFPIDILNEHVGNPAGTVCKQCSS